MSSDGDRHDHRACADMLLHVADVVELDPARAADGVAAFVRRVGEGLGVDRIALGEVTTEGAGGSSRLAVTHRWLQSSDVAAGPRPVEDLILRSTGWWVARLRSGDPVEITEEAGLPPESGLCPEDLVAHDIRWALVVPMISVGELVGFLGLQASRPPAGLDPTRLRALAAASRVVGTMLHRLHGDRRLHLLEEINDAIDDFVVATDLEGRIVHANRAVQRRFGYTLDELLGEPAAVLMSPDNDDDTWRRIRAAHRNLLDGRATSWTGDALNRTRDGTDLWVSARVTSLHRHGRVDGLVVVSRDITRRKRVEQRLSILERVVEEMDHFVVVTDMAGRITFVNPAVERRFGYRAEDLLGRLGRVLLSPANPPGLADEIRSATAAGGWSGDLLNITRDGEEFWVSVDTTLVHEDGQPMVMVSLSHDITDRKSMEIELQRAVQAAERASRAKGEFVANMSHEIRTPLNAITGLVHLLQRTRLDAQQAGYVENLDRAASSLLDIVNDILDFSKIEAGRLELEQVPFDLGDLLDELAALAQTRASSKDVEVVFRVDRKLPSGLKGDPLRLKQVLVNLCDNAIKFTEQGEVVVVCSLGERTDSGIVLRFSVRDTGIGMSPHQLERLFEPFQQADGSTTRRFGGSGLGLSICRRLVELMGGEITVDSEPGRGTEFVFTARLGLGTQARERSIPERPGLRGLTVLVVDDNATARLSLQEMLEEFGFEVHAAASAATAFDLLERAPADRPFELVLMDWQMPGMDGLEATRRIKSSSRLPFVPTIIMVTAFGREEVLREGEDGTILDGFLVKPVRPSTLFDAIADVLAPTDDLPTAPMPRTPRPEWASLRGARILLVEDNAVNQLVASEILEGEGLRVDVAETGAEALEMLSESRFDLVLMDIHMPEMDGLEATARIQAMERHRDLPIVAMTASTLDEDRQRYLAAGMADFVPKPIDIDHLFGVLLRWIPSDRHPPGGPASPATGGGEDSPAEEPPVLDAQGGLARVRGKEELYRRILTSFLSTSRDLRTRLQAAVTSGAATEVQRLAHSLKGSAATVGAERVRAAAAVVEDLLREDPEADVSTPARAVADEIGHARRVIEDFLDSPST